MITMTFEQLRKFNGNRSLVSKLYHTPMQPLLTFRIKMLLKALNKVGVEATEKRKTLLADLAEKYGKKDLEGKLIRPEGDPDGFDFEPEHKDAIDQASRDFEQQTFSLTSNPLKVEQLTNSKIEFSVAEIDALEPLVTGVDEAGEEAPSNVVSLK